MDSPSGLKFLSRTPKFYLETMGGFNNLPINSKSSSLSGLGCVITS